jgi:hypothetical protein
VNVLAALLCLGLVASGCGGHSDAQVQRELVGTWVVAGNYRNGGSFQSTFSIGRRGDYACRVVGTGTSGSLRTNDLEGTMRVSAGMLIDTMTKHSNTNAVLPMSSRGRIVRFDGRELVLKWVPNQEMIFPTSDVVFRRVEK